MSFLRAIHRRVQQISSVPPSNILDKCTFYAPLHTNLEAVINKRGTGLNPLSPYNSGNGIILNSSIYDLNNEPEPKFWSYRIPPSHPFPALPQNLWYRFDYTDTVFQNLSNESTITICGWFYLESPQDILNYPNLFQLSYKGNNSAHINEKVEFIFSPNYRGSRPPYSGIGISASTAVSSYSPHYISGTMGNFSNGSSLVVNMKNYNWWFIAYKFKPSRWDNSAAQFVWFGRDTKNFDIPNDFNSADLNVNWSSLQNHSFWFDTIGISLPIGSPWPTNHFCKHLQVYEDLEDQELQDLFYIYDGIPLDNTSNSDFFDIVVLSIPKGYYCQGYYFDGYNYAFHDFNTNNTFRVPKYATNIQVICQLDGISTIGLLSKVEWFFDGLTQTEIAPFIPPNIDTNYTLNIIPPNISPDFKIWFFS